MICFVKGGNIKVKGGSDAAGIGGGEKAAGTVADPSTGSQEETE